MITNPVIDEKEGHKISTQEKTKIGFEANYYLFLTSQKTGQKIDLRKRAV